MKTDVTERIEVESKYLQKILQILKNLKCFLVNIEILEKFEKKIDISLPFNNTSLTFGIKEEDLGNLFYRRKLFIEKFNCNLTIANRIYFSKTERMTNIYIKCEYSILIQLSIFYERFDYYWIGADLIDDKSHKKWFGDTQRLMSKINKIEELKIGMASILIPSDVKRFLFDYSHSIMLKCNQSLADENFKLSNGKYKQNLRKNSKILPGFKYLIQKLESSYKSYWLDGGTLLGLYRDCGIIPHTLVCILITTYIYN
jgi:hypothetical protein